jgi:transcriptional regulator with XRE-family HTH domain
MAVKPTAGRVFGEHLRELRQKRGLTQVDLAERCGFPQARISELERGGRTPNLVTIIRLALALECKVSALVSVFDKEDLAKLVPK